MGRQKRSKKAKLKLPVFFEDLKAIIVKKLIAALVVAVFILVLIFLVKAFLGGSSYFDLKQVEVNGLSEMEPSNRVNVEILDAYRGKNIFKINLKTLASYLQGRYPNAKHVTVMRDLPDKLSVSFYFRKPVALLSDAGYCPVDDEGFIVSNLDPSAVKDLPSISGVYTGLNTRSIESRNLKSALELLKEIKKARYMSRYKISRIDAGDPKAMSFYINELEIRIGNENLKERLERFRKLLKDPRLAIDRVRYVDLRFDDVVIGPR
ncbi:MAG: cell division protein FtsQ/DivIB [Candidatus Omnitrophica bacterium]|nr:cell division protein FtsQ/DivIB [Candidatus Omnitrophota bacterium]